MLRKPFEQAQKDIADYLSQRDFQTGETWYEFCRKRGFSHAEMMEGMDWQPPIKNL